MAKPKDTDPVIEVAGLDQRFGDTVIFEGLDLSVERGEAVSIIGGSGSGKTILLKSVLGLHRPTGGTIRVLGHDPLHLALTGGEDYELAVTVGPGQAVQLVKAFSHVFNTPATIVGHCTDAWTGVRVDGEPPARGGWDHFG